jgi:hypothetical protein
MLEDEGPPVALADFEQQLKKLKAEREALDAALRSASRRPAPTVPADDDVYLEWILKQALRRIQDRSQAAPPTGPTIAKEGSEPPKEPKKDHDPAKHPKDEKPPLESGGSGSGDPLLTGHALMRAEKYAAALEAFRQVDLKEKKAEERAPIQLLMATCCLNLGKNSEALDLLREVANSRADEQVAGYAQWQLEMHRWRQDVTGRLQDARQRRLALEKRP